MATTLEAPVVTLPGVLVVTTPEIVTATASAPRLDLPSLGAFRTARHCTVRGRL
jgi:hypothetical protein